MPLFRQAMEIWLPELPDIQLVQNFHRIPMEHHLLEELADSRTTLMSTARTWHLTFPIVLWNLRPHAEPETRHARHLHRQARSACSC
jgi:hypothetical protein